MHFMETTVENPGRAVFEVSIDRAVDVQEKMRELGISLAGISGKDIAEMDKASVEESITVSLNRGRIFPRSKQRPGEFVSDYSYGEELLPGERGLTPSELFSMLEDGSFKGLRGVYIPGRPGKKELLFLDMEERKLEAHPFMSEAPNPQFPNFETAKRCAFPTVKIPVK